MFLGSATPLSRWDGTKRPPNLWDLLYTPHDGMTSSYQILHGEQTRLEENCTGQKVLTRMLTRDHCLVLVISSDLYLQKVLSPSTVVVSVYYLLFLYNMNI